MSNDRNGRERNMTLDRFLCFSLVTQDGWEIAKQHRIQGTGHIGHLAELLVMSNPGKIFQIRRRCPRAEGTLTNSVLYFPATKYSFFAYM